MDGYVCAAGCSATFPGDGTACLNGAVLGSLGACAAACVGWDALAGRYSLSVDLGADGGATTLAAAVDNASTGVWVVSAQEAGIVGGKSLLVDSEVRR